MCVGADARPAAGSSITHLRPAARVAEHGSRGGQQDDRRSAHHRGRARLRPHPGPVGAHRPPLHRPRADLQRVLSLTGRPLPGTPDPACGPRPLRPAHRHPVDQAGAAHRNPACPRPAIRPRHAERPPVNLAFPTPAPGAAGRPRAAGTFPVARGGAPSGRSIGRTSGQPNGRSRTVGHAVADGRSGRSRRSGRADLEPFWPSRQPHLFDQTCPGSPSASRSSAR